MTTSGENPSEPYGQPPYAGQPYGAQPAAATSEERNWAMASHVGSLLAAWFALGLLAPLIVLLAKGGESAFVRRHAVESLNFQINALVYTVVFGLLVLVLIGIPLLILYGIFYLVCVVLATVRSSNGEEFRYPFTIRLVT